MIINFNQRKMIKKIEKIAKFLMVLALVGILIVWMLPPEPASSHTVTATVAAVVTCTTPLSTTAFPTIDNTAVFTSSPDATTTVNSNTGVYMRVYDVGGPDATGTPSLYKSTATTDNIGSADSAYADTATLVAGTEGYGIQATTTGPNMAIAPRFLQTGDAVGGLEAGSAYSVVLASSSAAVADEVVTIIHKAAVPATQTAGDYSDTITITCTVN